MILLIIIFNNILLSLAIALTYYHVFEGLLFKYTKPHPSIVGKCLLYFVWLNSTSAIILFIGKYTIYYFILLKIISSSLSLLLSYNC